MDNLNLVSLISISLGIISIILGLISIHIALLPRKKSKIEWLTDFWYLEYLIKDLTKKKDILRIKEFFQETFVRKYRYWFEYDMEDIFKVKDDKLIINVKNLNDLINNLSWNPVSNRKIKYRKVEIKKFFRRNSKWV